MGTPSGSGGDQSEEGENGELHIIYDRVERCLAVGVPDGWSRAGGYERRTERAVVENGLSICCIVLLQGFIEFEHQYDIQSKESFGQPNVYKPLVTEKQI